MSAPASSASSTRRAIMRAHCTSARNPSTYVAFGVETSRHVFGRSGSDAPVRSRLGLSAHERAGVATRGGLVYGGNRTSRRVKALTGACLTAGALVLGAAGGAQAQTPLPDTHNIPTNAV